MGQVQGQFFTVILDCGRMCARALFRVQQQWVMMQHFGIPTCSNLAMPRMLHRSRCVSGTRDYKYCDANVSISVAGSSVKHPLRGESRIAFENEFSIISNISSRCPPARNLSRISHASSFNSSISASASSTKTRCQSRTNLTSAKPSPIITTAMLMDSSLSVCGT